MTATGSSVPRRQLGRYLRHAREAAGVSIQAAAESLELSRARMYRIEAGETSVRRIDAEAMCRFYGTDPELTEVLVGLAAETKGKGWWQAYGDVVPTWFELYVGLEAAASRLRQYESLLIPGLLQLPEYSTVLFASKPGATAEYVEQKVALRRDRQRLLTRRAPKPPIVDVVIDEAVLRKQITDTGAWCRQLAHLVNVAQRGRIGVRVLPDRAGPHWTSVTGSFVILDFPRLHNREPEPTTVYSENLTGALYLDRPGEVAAYTDAWDALEDLALEQRASEDLIGTIIKEISDD